METKIVSKTKKIWLFADFKENKTYKISFSYETIPKKALYFSAKKNHNNNYEGKYE